MLLEESLGREERKQRLVSKTVKNTRAQAKKHSDKISLNKFQTRIVPNSSLKNKQPEEHHNADEPPLSRKAQLIIESIKQDERRLEEEAQTDAHESDGFS